VAAAAAAVEAAAAAPIQASLAAKVEAGHVQGPARDGGAPGYEAPAPFQTLHGHVGKFGQDGQLPVGGRAPRGCRI
jgi:hypothetical protein